MKLTAYAEVYSPQTHPHIAEHRPPDRPVQTLAELIAEHGGYTFTTPLPTRETGWMARVAEATGDAALTAIIRRNRGRPHRRGRRSRRRGRDLPRTSLWPRILVHAGPGEAFDSMVEGLIAAGAYAAPGGRYFEVRPPLSDQQLAALRRLDCLAPEVSVTVDPPDVDVWHADPAAVAPSRGFASHAWWRWQQDGANPDDRPPLDPQQP
jgi:hypothetical protein